MDEGTRQFLIQRHKKENSLIQTVESAAQKKKMELKLTFEFVLACKRGREKKLIKTRTKERKIQKERIIKTHNIMPCS